MTAATGALPNRNSRVVGNGSPKNTAAVVGRGGTSESGLARGASHVTASVKVDALFDSGIGDIFELSSSVVSLGAWFLIGDPRIFGPFFPMHGELQWAGETGARTLSLGAFTAGDIFVDDHAYPDTVEFPCWLRLSVDMIAKTARVWLTQDEAGAEDLGGVRWYTQSGLTTPPPPFTSVIPDAQLFAGAVGMIGMRWHFVSGDGPPVVVAATETAITDWHFLAEGQTPPRSADENFAARSDLDQYIANPGIDGVSVGPLDSLLICDGRAHYPIWDGTDDGFGAFANFSMLTHIPRGGRVGVAGAPKAGASQTGMRRR